MTNNNCDVVAKLLLSLVQLLTKRASRLAPKFMVLFVIDRKAIRRKYCRNTIRKAVFDDVERTSKVKSLLATNYLPEVANDQKD